MSPPHESATSSGWGAMKTWVMAAGVYGADGDPPRLSAVPARPRPMSGTNTQGPSDHSRHSVAVALHDEQLLLAARAHRDDQPPPVAELLAERVRDRRARPPRRGSRPTAPRPGPQRAVAGADLDAVRRSPARRGVAGRGREAGLALDGWSPGSRAPPGPPPGSRSRCRRRGRARRARLPGARSCARRCTAG